MNYRKLLRTFGNVSVEQIIVASTIANYYKTKYPKSRVVFSTDILRLEQPLIAHYSQERINYLLGTLVKLEVLTESYMPGQKMRSFLQLTGSTNSFKDVDERTLQERQEDFYKEVMSHNVRYSKEMLESFYNWWGASDQKTQRMRFEDADYFETGKRLATWFSKNKVSVNKDRRGQSF